MSRLRNLHEFFKTMRDVSTQYKLCTCRKCLVNIRGQIQYKQHVESCDKHYCNVCNKRFHSNQTYQKHLKNCPPQRFASQNCRKTYSRKSDTDTHNRKCIKTSNYKYDFSQTMQTHRNQYH